MPYSYDSTLPQFDIAISYLLGIPADVLGRRIGTQKTLIIENILDAAQRLGSIIPDGIFIFHFGPVLCWHMRRDFTWEKMGFRIGYVEANKAKQSVSIFCTRDCISPLVIDNKRYGPFDNVATE